MQDSESTLASGATFGRYVLVERLGRGAMGEVWVAIDPDLDRKVALKLLRSDRLARPEDRARLDAEARAMARLTHPNVVTIHDVGRLGDQVFIAMEFVDGESLDQWIDRGPHPWQTVLEILREAAAGLEAAHDAGLIHRDFKPANVMLGRDGRVRVLDFGLARPEGSAAKLDAASHARESELDDIGETRSRTTIVEGKRIQGTPAYMAPEQHRGGAVDARSDLFSFCVSLFEALYGVRPFRGANRMTVALAIVAGRIIELPPDVRARVPDWIHAIVVRGLATQPDQRFADMRALLAALERSPEQRRRTRAVVTAAVVGLGSMVALAVALWPGREPDPCLASGDTIAEVWTEAARTDLRSRLDGVAGARSPAGPRVMTGLDRHVGDWQVASEQLCRDRHAKRVTERLLSSRADCLASSYASLRALVVLGDDPVFLAGLARHPLAGIRALGDPSRCVDRAALADERPTPNQIEREARATLELLLAVDADAATLASAIDRIHGQPEAEPELALLLGRAVFARGDLADAEARLHACAAVAVDQDPHVAGRAWLGLVELELARLDAPADPDPTQVRERASTRDRAVQLLAYADALVPGHERDARTELGLLAGRLALHDPEPAPPPASLDSAVTELVAEPGEDSDQLLALLDVRARIYTRLGESSAAARDRARAETLPR